MSHFPPCRHPPPVRSIRSTAPQLIHQRSLSLSLSLSLVARRELSLSVLPLCSSGLPEAEQEREIDSQLGLIRLAGFAQLLSCCRVYRFPLQIFVYASRSCVLSTSLRHVHMTPDSVFVCLRSESREVIVSSIASVTWANRWANLDGHANSPTPFETFQLQRQLQHRKSAICRPVTTWRSDSCGILIPVPWADVHFVLDCKTAPTVQQCSNSRITRVVVSLRSSSSSSFLPLLLHLHVCTPRLHNSPSAILPPGLKGWPSARRLTGSVRDELFGSLRCYSIGELTPPVLSCTFYSAVATALPYFTLAEMPIHPRSPLLIVLISRFT
ncbi:unnamed protein product [Protopolystoma xenopodis]|uniref:Uncharacterized protein n=1 Tax=Protopolystoma xenopodis TaxID=117903 RepID=A0A3S4ZQU4_9PLAT|nr:unnamed protein product [Protopolystoma xenopodis]